MLNQLNIWGPNENQQPKFKSLSQKKKKEIKQNNQQISQKDQICTFKPKINPQRKLYPVYQLQMVYKDPKQQFNDFPLTNEQKITLKNSLFQRWRELNQKYQKFAHKENFKEVMKERLIIEQQMSEIENMFEILKQKRVYIKTN